MNARFAPLLLVIPLLAFADPSPAVLKGPHYTVTSWAGPEAGQNVLDLMEALAARYNSLFLYDLSKAGPWNVTLYASKKDFDAALSSQVPTVPNDYTYLHYSDPAKSVLAAWVTDKDSPINEARSLAFQGFFQFLWTFVPHPPAWIETGLASVFWNTDWDGKTLTASADSPFLDTLQAKWKDKAPDLKALLSAPEGTVTAATGLDVEAWALASFLLDSPDPVYSRLFGSALADLSATGTEEANRNAVIQRFQAVKTWDAEAADVQTYWKNKAGFAAQLAQGTALLKDKNYAGAKAAFSAALAMRPTDNAALYYSGLTAYESKDYTAADATFAKVDDKALPPGLLAYARGLTAFALKQNDAAKTWLTAAKTADEAQFGKLVGPVLDTLK
jgi:hypothetical protein